MDLGIRGKLALVCASSRGLGRACADALAREGVDVVINYVTNPEAAEEVAHQIEDMGHKAIVLKADVSNEDEVKRALSRMDAEVLAAEAVMEHEFSSDPGPDLADMVSRAEALRARAGGLTALIAERRRSIERRCCDV